MNCPTCGAPLDWVSGDDSLHCEYCQGVYVPEKNADGVRRLGASSPLTCPVCNVPLEQAVLAGRHILCCSRCQGMLVGMDDFVALIEELRADRGGGGSIQPAPDRKGLERRIACPQCRQPMDTHFYDGPGNVIIDDCSRCSLDWLDAGELMRVVRAPGHEYAQEPTVPGEMYRRQRSD